MGKVATLAWTVLAARSLTQAEFGVFFFALTLGLLLSAAASWGFVPVMVQEASVDPTRLPGHLTSTLAWQLLLGIPLFVLAGIVAAALRPSGDARTAIALVLAAVLLDMLSESNRAASAAAQDQAGTAKALVLQRFVTVVLIAVALALGGGLVGLCTAFLAASVVGFVAHQWAARSLGVRIDCSALAPRQMFAFLRLTPLIGLTALLLMLLFRLDALLLAALQGDAAVGVYAAAYRLLETVLFIVFALRSAVFPVMSATAAPAVVRRGVETGFAAIAVVYLPFAAVCLVEARSVLTLLYGDSYAEQGASVLRWLALAPLAYGVAFLVNAALQSRRRLRPMLLAALAATVANIVLNLALIPHFAAAAAAFTTTVSYVLESVILLVILRRLDPDVRLGRPLLESGIASIVAAVILIVLRLPLLVELPVAVLAYSACWVMLAQRWSPEQLWVVKSVLPKRLGAAG